MGLRKVHTEDSGCMGVEEVRGEGEGRKGKVKGEKGEKGGGRGEKRGREKGENGEGERHPSTLLTEFMFVFQYQHLFYSCSEVFSTVICCKTMQVLFLKN